jgi:hypothetical protein
MSKEILMQFVGFESKDEAREYTFTVRESATDSRDFTIAIAHEAFRLHGVRFQDAPAICALRLRRELASSDNHPLECRFQISDAELEDYRASHAPPKKTPFARAPVEDY